MGAEVNTGATMKAHDNFMLRFFKPNIIDGTGTNAISAASTTNFGQFDPAPRPR